MFLEVIAKNFADVKEINNSQANRIELCTNLACGGMTPSHELIFAASNYSKLPVNVIIRANERLDFVFNADEKQKMLDDVKYIATKTKANGIVIGALTADKKIDFEFIKQILAVKGNLQTTFHKAFDLVDDKIAAWKEIEQLNFTNVLTSGGLDINQGFAVLGEIAKVRTNCHLLIGGGVTLDNLSECLKYSDNIHIGTAARTAKNWDSEIAIPNINTFKAAH
jgi:copper homeostasis protein